VYIMDTSSDEAVLKLENSARVKSISQWQRIKINSWKI
jgi:hypothetical protein